MRITTVRYRRLQSHDRGYGHDAVEAEAQVGDDETAEDAIAALKTWVHGELSHLKETRDLVETLTSLRERVAAEERSLDRAKREVTETRGIIKQHAKLVELARANGLDAEAEAIDVLPF